LRPDLPPGIDEVFARVLAKQPGDRYGTCREFIDAARVALGGLPSTGSQTFGLPDTQTAVVHAGLSPSAPALEPLPGPASRAATGLPPEVAHSGDTIVSHRRYAGHVPPPDTPREPGGRRPPPGPSRRRAGRWYRRPRWIAALTALVLIAAGAGTWALVSGGSGSHPLARPTMSMSMPKPKPTPTSALMIEASIQWNYTTALNIICLVLAAVLCYRFTRTGGIAMLKMMGGQPDAGH
jgi:hypothetical protein